MIEYFDQLDSTNAYCLRNVEDLMDGTLVVALEQTAGRGRCGRKWISPPSQNFYGSLVIKPPFGKTRIEHLPQLAALAVTDVLPEFGISDAWVKWPNDVFVDNAKICGVLAECSHVAGAEILVIGIGVNLNMPPDQLAAIDRPATSLFKETGKTTRLERFSVALYDSLLHWRELATEDPGKVYAEWVRRIPLIGREVEVVTPSTTLVGIVKAILPDGSIQIVGETGVEESFVSGDVSLRT